MSATHDREFASEQELRAHYGGVRSRLREAMGKRQREKADARLTLALQLREEARARARADALRRAEAEQHLAGEEAAALRIGAEQARSRLAIIAAVENRHGLPRGSIRGVSRAPVIVAARYEAMREVRQAFPEASLPSLGRTFKRDSTSLCRALRNAGVWPYPRDTSGDGGDA